MSVQLTNAMCQYDYISMSVRLYVDEKGSFATSYSDDEHNYGQHTRSMVHILEIWSTYQNYGQHTRIMVNIPDLQKYGQHTRNMDNIPESTINMVNIPEILTIY